MEGMLTNVNIFFKYHELQNLTEWICDEEITADIAWKDMVWSHTGNVVLRNFSLENICLFLNNSALTLPLLYNHDKAMSTCHKGRPHY